MKYVFSCNFKILHRLTQYLYENVLSLIYSLYKAKLLIDSRVVAFRFLTITKFSASFLIFVIGVF